MYACVRACVCARGVCARVHECAHVSVCTYMRKNAHITFVQKLCETNMYTCVPLYINCDVQNNHIHNIHIRAHTSLIMCVCQIVLENCRVTNATSDGDGGALLISNSSLLVVDSHFEENSARKGGSLAIVDEANAQITDTTIKSCSAEEDGGGAYVASASTIVMDRILLTLNVAVTGNGGALMIEDYCRVHGTKIVMSNNAANQGGGLFVQYHSHLVLTGGFSCVGNNVIQYGACFLAYWNCTVDLSDGPEMGGGIDVLDNHAALGGSGIWMYGPEGGYNHFTSRGEMNFRDNWSGGCCGGAFINWGGVAELSAGVKFSDNLAMTGGASMCNWFTGTVIAFGVVFENNHAKGLDPNTGEVSSSYGGGGIWHGESATTYLYGGIFKENSAHYGAAFFDDGYLKETGTIVMQEVSFVSNIAYLDGGACRFFGRKIRLYRVLFRSNAASRHGGGILCESQTLATIDSCSFFNDTARSNGGSLALKGMFGSTNVTSTTFERGTAREGGCIHVSGNSRLKLNHSHLLECVATFGDGGGICTRDDSVLTLVDGVAIRHCKALEGKGGGLLAAGGALTIAITNNLNHVVVEKNRAKNGGGVSYLSPVHLHGAGKTLISLNGANQNGGGLFGFSSFAKLQVGQGHKLWIEDNIADNDGGGIALVQGARFTVISSECGSDCAKEMNGNGICDLGCMTSGCNWDSGDCNYLFEEAGSDAQKPCTCLTMFYFASNRLVCQPRGDPGCFRASCDWNPYGDVCDYVFKNLAVR